MFTDKLWKVWYWVLWLVKIKVVRTFVIETDKNKLLKPSLFKLQNVSLHYELGRTEGSLIRRCYRHCKTPQVGGLKDWNVENQKLLYFKTIKNYIMYQHIPFILHIQYCSVIKEREFFIQLKLRDRQRLIKAQMFASCLSWSCRKAEAVGRCSCGSNPV